MLGLMTSSFGANPTHPLARLQKSAPNNPRVPYVEELVKFILAVKASLTVVVGSDGQL
jgi:hypothetical protein